MSFEDTTSAIADSNLELVSRATNYRGRAILASVSAAALLLAGCTGKQHAAPAESIVTPMVSTASEPSILCAPHQLGTIGPEVNPQTGTTQKLFNIAFGELSQFVGVGNTALVVTMKHPDNTAQYNIEYYPQPPVGVPDVSVGFRTFTPDPLAKVVGVEVNFTGTPPDLNEILANAKDPTTKLHNTIDNCAPVS